jgi:hypothetical protein
MLDEKAFFTTINQVVTLTLWTYGMTVKKTKLLLLTVIAFFITGCTAEQTVAMVSIEDATGIVYNDLNGNGSRDAGEHGIENVTVSNGTDVVTTDKQGCYKLHVSDDCIIFVIKPAGWKTPLDENNLPRFYYINKPSGSPSYLKFPAIAPTGSQPASIDFPLQRQDESDTFNVLLFGDIQVSKEKELIYFRRQLAEVIGTQAAFGISLGDNVGDNLSLFDGVNRAVAVLGLPWYNTSGNHDINFYAPDDTGSLDTFKSIYGPTNYAFNYGKTHFVVLDSIIAKRTKDERLGYDEGLGAEELTFIANDLKYVKDDTLVILLIHGGLQHFSQDRDVLFAMLKDFEHSLSIAGHDHFLMHKFYTATDNFHGRNPHHYYTAGAVCGGWWMGTPEPFSDTPHSMMYDGVPGGYTVLALDGNNYSMKYKAFGKPDDFQMTISAPDEVRIEQLSETEVTVNVFAASERATVKMNIDGKSWFSMALFTGPDPCFVKMSQWEEANNIYRHSWSKKPQQQLLWKATLPENLAKGLHIINIKATDMFGRTFAAKRLIKVKQ